jgi:hypothetical protein
MSPPRWVDEDGPAQPDAPVSDVRARDPGQPLAREDAADHEALALPGDHLRRVVRASARGGAGARRGRVVRGDPGAGRGDVSYSGTPSRISSTTASSCTPSRIARALSRSTIGRVSRRRRVTTALSGCPGGLGRRLVAVLAICSGVGGIFRGPFRGSRGKGLGLGMRGEWHR